MPLQKHLRELWDGICECGATARPGSLGMIQTLLGVCTFLSWCHFCLSELACLLLPSLLFPHPQDIPICISFPSPSSCLVLAGPHTHWSAFSEPASVHRHAVITELGLPGSQSWDLGSPLLITGQFVVLICLANEELTFLRGCVLLKWQPKQKQSSQGTVGLSDPFGGFQSKGSQVQKSTSQCWLPCYWAWRNSTKSGQCWSNLPPAH